MLLLGGNTWSVTRCSQFIVWRACCNQNLRFVWAFYGGWLELDGYT